MSNSAQLGLGQPGALAEWSLEIRLSHRQGGSPWALKVLLFVGAKITGELHEQV